MHTIGQTVQRNDALDKVTGRAVYASDLSMPGMLHLQVVFAGRPHARIVSVDPSEALAQPGTVAVFTARDVPVNRYGLITDDQPVLCDDKVRFVGDQVAIVLAETPEQAWRAAQLVRVTYGDLPVIGSAKEAMAPGAVLVHEGYPGNLAHSVLLNRGDVGAALAEADVVVDRVYTTPMQEHAYLEPELGLGYIDQQGRVAVHVAGQCTHDDQRQIAQALGLPLDQVRVIYGAIGGAFGGREDISVQIVLALAAWKMKRPVKTTWNREELILGHGKRHAMQLHYTWGAMKDGTISAAKIHIMADAGAYMCTSGAVLDNFRFAAIGPYNIPNVAVSAQAYYTNNIPGCAFRGFGTPQTGFASEMQMAHLAEELGIDPISLRLKNLLKQDELLATETPLPGGMSLAQLLEVCVKEAGGARASSGWTLPSLESSNPGKRRGLGLAIGMKNSGFTFVHEGSSARVVLHGTAAIERAEVHTAAADVGQGSHSVLAQIAAEVLNIPITRVEMKTSDTADIGDSGPASASRLTYIAGQAIKQAAEMALQKWKDEDRPAVGECRWEAVKPTVPNPIANIPMHIHSFAYGAHVAEVEVDIHTGTVTLLRVIVAQDPGRAVNPQQVRGQIEGGVVQAQGWSLTEDFVMKNGQAFTDRFSTYLIPTVLDIPEQIHSVLVEAPDPNGPFGVRGVGEIPFIPVAPAIACAVHDATGVWIDALPLTPEKMLTHLENRAALAETG